MWQQSDSNRKCIDHRLITAQKQYSSCSGVSPCSSTVSSPYYLRQRKTAQQHVQLIVQVHDLQNHYNDKLLLSGKRGM